MQSHIVKIKKIEQITHDVKRFTLEKPVNYQFKAGQATLVSINKDSWKDKKREFTFTSLISDENLEFTIKIYKHNGVTSEIGKLKEREKLIIENPWGAIEYKGTGIFIAGGAGITPFIAILRQLNKEKKLKGNTLISSNKTEKDIILKEEFDSLIDLKKIYTLTRERNSKYEYGRVNEQFLREKINNFSQHFYICGPIGMVGELTSILQKLGAQPESIIIEN